MPEWIDADREGTFPFLVRDRYEKTSEETPDLRYNCAAYAAGDESRWWQPLQPDDEEPIWSFWPAGVPHDGTLGSYIKAFELSGFVLCDPGKEDGFERIALYAHENGLFTHAARQLPSGRWTSKLGDWEDIEHETPQLLEGGRPAYGFVWHYMKRPFTE